jgi:hypothetical protein
MIVGFHIGNSFSEIGSGDFLHSFFSTISFHLEPNGWGTRFPWLMNELYQGELKYDKSGSALIDAMLIKEELKACSPSKVVWDFDNPVSKPPWGDYADKAVTDLSNYHITSTDRVLMDLLIECLTYQTECKKPLTIKTLDQIYRGDF